MSEILADVLKTTVGAAAGVWFGYWVWLRQRVAEVRYAHDADLRERRRLAYARLWRSLAPLALHFPARDVDEYEIAKLGIRLRAWYFANGVLSSARTHEVYLMLAECLARIGAYAASLPVQGGLADSGQDGNVPKRRARYLVRARAEISTGADVKATRAELGLPSLSARVHGTPALYTAWRKRVELRLTVWKPGQPRNDFVFAQFLASSLRTLVTADLNSRDLSRLAATGD